MKEDRLRYQFAHVRKLILPPGETCDAIRYIGGTMPENLPPAEDIKQVRKRLKSRTPPLELNGPDAKSLDGQERQ